jgi:hypothetical protein
MNQEDITKQIVALYEEDMLNQIMNTVNTELENGIPVLLQQEINACLRKISNKEVTNSENVVSFKSNSKKLTPVFAETELLAASGQSLADWFSQPLNFAGAGFILDIRLVFGTQNEIDLYLSPLDSEKMSASFEAYKGKLLQLKITNNNKPLLIAELYVDDAGQEAEGSGHLIDQGEKSVQGKLTIEIEVKE